MTSAEGVKRARSHSWYELNDQTECCSICLLILSKDTDLENVPPCDGRIVVRR